MPTLLDRLAEPFDSVGPDVAALALRDHWGITGRKLTRLETERDDTFRAGDVTIKIAHPSDSGELIDLQSSALAHIASVDAALPVQRVVPTRDGPLSAVVGGRVTRVLTWIEGDLLHDSPWSPPLMSAAGGVLARLNVALSSFEHPAADRWSAWDLPRLPELRSHTSDPRLLAFIDRFTADVSPRLDALPHQVVHNDFHPGNVLVDASAASAASAGGDGVPAITGVLDFGDIARTPRIADLAIALTYLVPDRPRPWPEFDAFRAGFEEVVPLLPDEIEVLPMLIAARTVMRTIINNVMNPDDAQELRPFYEGNARRLTWIVDA